MIEETPAQPTIEEAKELFSLAFIRLLNHIDSEPKRQLKATEDYKLFRRAYSAAYPDDCRRIVKSYKLGSAQPRHPVEVIRASRSPYREAERQALFVIGAQILKQTNSGGVAIAIVQEIAFQNEIHLPESVLTNILAVQDFLDSIE